jgi:hypothetical protein
MSVVDQYTLRANPRYELVLVDRLTKDERHVLGDLDDDDLYGILRPSRDSELDTRACSPDTALLFFALREPSTLPAFVRKALGNDGERVLARLVFDGVLEVWTDAGFRSGPSAADLVLPGRSIAGQGRIADLSIAALRYGQALAGLSVEALALRLYFYGRRPISPELRRRMPDEKAVDAFVGIVPDGPVTRLLDKTWVQQPNGFVRPSPWRYWASRSARRGVLSSDRADTAYKLYVSPALDAMPTAVAAVAGSLATSPGVNGFKIARDLAGICRPDKIIVYFGRLDDLRECASRVAEQVAGIPAHGVPFTAVVTLDGLLSWGADPPPNLTAATSWRMWVAERLAEYLIVVRRKEGRDNEFHDLEAKGIRCGEGEGWMGTEPWQLALKRLRLAGVDTDTWVPASGMWREAMATS